MGTSVIILTIAVVLALIEVPLLKKKGHQRDIRFFYLFLGLAVGVSILAAKHTHYFNPLELIVKIYEPITSRILGWLQ
ncbi:hypothetical protein [Rubeoparvulum massiliense]|uniref:hypothetical protein n=1 Tax=Rubeoparvulum massiliense TaxID=1631346 RepID=UPI00065E6C30|nr:hypothetical protein [Rubeoparvulum massiliense]